MTMVVVMWVAAALAGAIHVLFFCMESLWWTKPAVFRRFRSTEAQAQMTKSLAFNQGFYNLFLAVVTAVGIAAMLLGHTGVGAALVFAGVGSMLAAAAVLLASSPDKARAAVTQGAFPLIAVVLLAIVVSR